MSNDNTRMTCVKLSVETRAAVDDYCRAHEISISDLLRSLLEMVTDGRLAPGDIEGYKRARTMALVMAGDALNKAIEDAAGYLPATYEEALRRYGFVPE